MANFVGERIFEPRQTQGTGSLRAVTSGPSDIAITLIGGCVANTMTRAFHIARAGGYNGPRINKSLIKKKTIKKIIITT
jgi:hypothetical protein